jgi:pimeloyl-ACP methyl ester carboxylesterase
MQGYVLVHGGGFGSACWDRLRPLLREPVLAVDLPGRGTRAGDDLRTVSTQDCAEAVAADIEAADLRDVVLVGHSLAGVVVPRVLALVPDRLRAAVLVAAIVPAEGETVMSTMAPATREAVGPAIADGLYRPGDGAGLEMLCHDLDEEQTAFVVRTRTDDSARLLTDPTDLSGLDTAVPRWWVRLTRDRRVPPDLQTAGNGRWRGTEVSLDTGHMAMVADPVGLAAILERIGREPSSG